TTLSGSTRGRRSSSTSSWHRATSPCSPPCARTSRRPLLSPSCGRTDWCNASTSHPWATSRCATCSRPFSTGRWRRSPRRDCGGAVPATRCTSRSSSAKRPASVCSSVAQGCGVSTACRLDQLVWPSWWPNASVLFTTTSWRRRATARAGSMRRALWRLDGGGTPAPGLLLAAARQAHFAFDGMTAERLARAAWAADHSFAAAHVLADVLFARGGYVEREELLAELAATASTDDERAVVAVSRALGWFW